MPTLPFDDIDVLVSTGGKDISGTTMDPNVTGRFWVTGLPDPTTPRVAMIVLLGLTGVTAGNVLGIGFADFVPASLAAEIDWQQTYLNSFTAGAVGVRRARLPMVLPDEESCVQAALRCAASRSRAQAGRAHRVDAAPDPLLGQRRTAGRAPAGCQRRPRSALASQQCPIPSSPVEQRPDGTEWFVPTDHARRPWDPDSCHGGPPTGLLVRALQTLVLRPAVESP